MSSDIIGNNVTLTLSWREPFNNLDPIVHYTVSCSGDVTCPPDFITTDHTTRSYTITNLTLMTDYTFSVVATNSIGSGEAGVVRITTPGKWIHARSTFIAYVQGNYYIVNIYIKKLCTYIETKRLKIHEICINFMLKNFKLLIHK